MVRAWWIGSVLCLALVSYALAPISRPPVEVSARDYWNTLFGLEYGTAIVEPFQGRHYLFRAGACGQVPAELGHVSCEDVEAGVPEALAALRQWLDQGEAEGGWREALAEEFAGERPGARELSEATLRLRREEALGADYSEVAEYGIDPEEFRRNRLQGIEWDRSLSTPDQQRLRRLPWLVLGELVSWSLLLLLLLGLQPPTRSSIAWAAARGALCPWVAVGFAFLLVPYSEDGGWFGSGVNLTRGESWLHLYRPRVGQLLLASACFACGAALWTWAWRRSRPQLLRWVALESLILSLPIALVVLEVLESSRLGAFGRALEFRSLVSWETSVLGSAWLLAALVTFAIRMRCESTSPA